MDRCTICGLEFTEPSYGGPGICPSCDCGDFGINKIQRQAREIIRLRGIIKQMENLQAYRPISTMIGAKMEKSDNGTYLDKSDVYNLLNKNEWESEWGKDTHQRQ